MLTLEKIKEWHRETLERLEHDQCCDHEDQLGCCEYAMLQAEEEVLYRIING